MLLQTWQQNVFLPVWTFICESKVHLTAKLLLQCSHLYGRSPVCVRICLMRSLGLRKVFGQYLHLLIYSFVSFFSTFSWIIRWHYHDYKPLCRCKTLRTMQISVLTSARSMIFLSATASIKTFSETDGLGSTWTFSIVVLERSQLEEIRSFWELSGSVDETFQASVCILLWNFNCTLLSSIFWQLVHFHRLCEKVKKIHFTETYSKNISRCYVN